VSIFDYITYVNLMSFHYWHLYMYLRFN